MSKYYRNWNEITRIGTLNKFIMLGLATIELDPLYNFDYKISEVVKMFPKCFNKEGDIGVVPFQSIVESAKQTKRYKEDRTIMPVVDCVIPGHIPKFELWYGDGVDFMDCDAELPEHISKDVAVGDLIPWRKSLWVVLENLEYGMITIAPAKCFNFDS